MVRCVSCLARVITKWTNACEKTLSQINVVHPFHEWLQTVLLSERQFENGFDRKWMKKKLTGWEYLFTHRQQELFLSVYVDDIKMRRKEKQSRNPMWERLMKQIDPWKEPTHLPGARMHLECTQTEPKDYRRVQELIQVFHRSWYDQTGICLEEVPR